MPENFLITGYGRSGTKFLSSVLNQSSKWQVEHEPRGSSDETRKDHTAQLERIKVDFRENTYYGEVNGYQRFHFLELPYKRALLLRDPYEILLSVANRKKTNQLRHYIKDIAKWYAIFLNEIDDERIEIFSFHKITTDLQEIQAVLNFASIDDIALSQVALQDKINTNRKIKFDSFNTLPKTVQYLSKKQFSPLQDRLKPLLR